VRRGPSHTYATGIADRELALPPALRTPTSLSAQLLATAGVSTMASALRGRAKPATAPAMVKG
jgi:hypothetical protein